MSQSDKCRICESSDFEQVLDLGSQPWGNGFLRLDQFESEQAYPLKLVRCSKCSLAQLDFTIPKERMFIEHTYLSGTTSTLSRHFNSLALEVYDKFLSNISKPMVLDIGSNDGTQLKYFKHLGCEVLGVESAPHAVAIANAAGIPTEQQFFNSEYAQKLNKKFDVINASGVFFHLEELHSVCDGVRLSLKPNGVFVIQFIYMKTMQDNIAFDQIYHEHLLYYTLETLNILLKIHGLEIFDAHNSPIHGGSMIAYASHVGSFDQSVNFKKLYKNEIESKTNDLESYQNFAANTVKLKGSTLKWFEVMSQNKKVVYGLGAPVKGNTLINYFGLGVSNLPFLVERNTLRKGLFSPGAHIPVILENEIPIPPDAYFVLAWNFKSEILERHSKDKADGIEFYFPIDPK